MKFFLASDHHTFCLRCKRRCRATLSNVAGNHQLDDLLPLIYNYLQMSYYKVGDIRRAAEAVGSYLTVVPDGEGSKMAGNREYYATQEGAEPGWFVARLEARAYGTRDKHESKLLEFADEAFTKLAVNK